MINRQTLLSDLQKLLQRLEADLLERSQSAEVPEVGQSLRAEYDRARTAERTAQNYEDWRTDAITQAAAAWVLSCVFVRFLEDNRLIDPPKMAGPAERLERSRDEHELYFRSHPTQTDREYLLAVFDQLGKLPGTKDVFGEHNPIRELPNWLSGDAAGEHGSWVICIRTCPRRRGRSTPYYRPPSLSKSSFSTERLIRRSMSLALMPRRCSTAAATRLQQPGFG